MTIHWNLSHSGLSFFNSPHSPISALWLPCTCFVGQQVTPGLHGSGTACHALGSQSHPRLIPVAVALTTLHSRPLSLYCCTASADLLFSCSVADKACPLWLHQKKKTNPKSSPWAMVCQNTLAKSFWNKANTRYTKFPRLAQQHTTNKNATQCGRSGVVLPNVKVSGDISASVANASYIWFPEPSESFWGLSK